MADAPKRSLGETIGQLIVIAILIAILIGAVIILREYVDSHHSNDSYRSAPTRAYASGATPYRIAGSPNPSFTNSSTEYAAAN